MTDQFKQLNALIQTIPKLESRNEIFDLTCKISEATENLKLPELKNISYNNELYINLIYNIFNNKYFFDNLKILVKSSSEDRSDIEKLKEQKQVVQLFLRLSFFMISVAIPVLGKKTILFINQQFSSSIKWVYSKLSDGNEATLQDILLTLASTNSDPRGFKKKIPLPLNINHLNMNLISSRVLIGSLVTKKICYWVLPDIFKSTAEHKIHPGKLFKMVYILRQRISHHKDYEKLLNDKYFSEKRKKHLIFFLSSLEDQNIDDLLFLVNEIGIDYRDEYLPESQDEKIRTATEIKNRVQDRFEKLNVFPGGLSTSNWSNKAFLNTIRFLSVLESIKKAKNHGWKIHTFNHFLNKWFIDMHTVVNYSKIGIDDEIVIYVEGPSDKIILENIYKKLYPEHQHFVFYDTGGRHEVFKKIDAVQINDLEKISFGIFDFDEAYNDFCGLRDAGENISGFGAIKGEEKNCLYRERKDGKNKVFAILLPVPKFRNPIASRELKNRSMLTLEMLFDDSVLSSCGNLSSIKIPGGSVNSFKGDKTMFAQKTKSFEREKFSNFKALFARLHELSKG